MRHTFTGSVRRSASLGVLVVSLLCAACGSTVPVGGAGATAELAAGQASGMEQPAAAAGDGLEFADLSGVDGGAPVDAQAGTGLDGGGAGKTGAGGGPAPGTPAGGRAGAASQPAGTRSGTAGEPAAAGRTDPIEVGIQILANGNSALSSLGFDVDYGDSRAQAEALIRDVNGRGGLAGRKIKPVYYVQDAADAQTTPDQKMQQACARWTQDHRVEVAVSPFSVTEVLLRCLAQRRVPFALAPGGGFDTHQYRAYGPYLSAPVEPSLSRWAPALVERLVAQPFFGKAARIGVIHIDNAHGHRTRQALHQALSAHGMAVSQYIAFSEQQDEAVAQLQSAVLTFKNAGITHVLPILPGGGAVSFFMIAAEQQQYRPRYGLSSHDAGGALLQSSVPPEQLKGARGMGWNPSFDVDDARDPGLTSSGKRCKKVMEDAGQDMSSRVARWSAFAFCDLMWELEGAFKGAPGTDPDTFLAGLHRLGAGFTPAATFRSRFGAQRPDGAAAVRDLHYHEGCGCFRYDGPLRSF